MARTSGSLGVSFNFEPQIAGPFDARAIVPTKADLTGSGNWTALDGSDYVYNGMTVTVAEDSTTSNNGIYVLTDATNVTDINNWLFVGSGGGGSVPTLDEVTDVGNTTTNPITVSVVNAITGDFSGQVTASMIGVNADNFNGAFEVNGISYQAGRVLFPKLKPITTGLKFLAIQTGSLGGFGELTTLDFSHFVSSSNTGSFLYSGSYDNGTSVITLYSQDQDYSLDLSGLAGGGDGLAITASYTGSVLTTNARSFNFTGNGIDVTNIGNAVTVTVNTGSADTGSLMVTGSVTNNVLTFEKGDGTTFNLTVDTGSGATDTNIGTTNLNLTSNRGLNFSGSSLTFDMLNGETFNIAAENNGLVGISLDNSEFQILGLASVNTAQVLGIDAFGNIKAMSTSSIGGEVDTFYTANGTISSNRTVTFNNSSLILTGSLNYVTIDTDEIFIPSTPTHNGDPGAELLVLENSRIWKTGSAAFNTPGGSDTQVQFNDGGVFRGESTFTYNKTSNTLTVQSAGTGTNRTTPAIELRASDTGLTLNDVIGQIQAAHYLDDTKNASIVFAADANWNAQGTFDSKIEFRVTEGTSEKVNTTMKASGRVGIGTTDPTNGFLEVNGDVSGTSIYASANIVAYSDARSKTNVETISGALDKVDAIRGVTYNKVEDPDGIRYMGVIAQELQEVLPEVVAEGEDGRLAVAYGNIVGVLIEAVKELRAEIKELKEGK